jgi:hypothetical protein
MIKNKKNERLNIILMILLILLSFFSYHQSQDRLSNSKYISISEIDANLGNINKKPKNLAEILSLLNIYSLKPEHSSYRTKYFPNQLKLSGTIYDNRCSLAPIANSANYAQGSTSTIS